MRLCTKPGASTVTASRSEMDSMASAGTVRGCEWVHVDVGGSIQKNIVCPVAVTTPTECES